MAVFTDFWKDTSHKVAVAQKRRLQAFFAEHPATFFTLWGTKALVWDVPKLTVKGSRKALDAWRGTGKKAPAPKVTLAPTAWAPSGPARRVTAVPVAGGGFVIDMTTSAAPAVAIIPIDRRQTMEAGQALLRGTLFGRGFLGLAAQLDAFIPIRAYEAWSVLQLLADVHRGMLRVSGGIDGFSDTVHTCGLHDRITHRLYEAAEGAESVASKIARAKRLVETIYEGQLEQDASGAASVQTLPVKVPSADLAAGIGPACTIIAAGFGAFLPEPDAEATSILDQIRIAQAGWALLASAFEELAPVLVKHRVSKRITTFVRAAGDEAAAVAGSFRAARTQMLSLYHGQMAQEASGTATIRTIPTRPAA